MNLYLARHGETDWNKQKLLMGQIDIPLNQTGEKQAELLRDKLKSVNFDLCYSSPLKRARKTAEIICKNHCEIIDDDLLKEKFAGKNEGKLIQNVNWQDPSMETDEKTKQRAKKFFEKIKNLDKENVLVVSHSGFLKNLRHVVLGLDGEVNYDSWDLKNCDFEILQINSKNDLKIVDFLFKNQDKTYRQFQSKLTPTVDIKNIVGVRTPILRKFAKELLKENNFEDFLNNLPHRYYDENNLHSFIISEIKNYDEVIQYIDDFLPFIDNWATCDVLSPKIFKKNRTRLKTDIDRWLNSKETYTIRFGIEMAMSHFLDEDFDNKFLEKISKIRSNEYYVNMMIAWFFATALAKQWQETIPYLEKNQLDVWTHNKTIQKALESFRISSEQKDYLRSLKIKS